MTKATVGRLVRRERQAIRDLAAQLGCGDPMVKQNPKAQMDLRVLKEVRVRLTDLVNKVQDESQLRVGFRAWLAFTARKAKNTVLVVIFQLARMVLPKGLPRRAR